MINYKPTDVYKITGLVFLFICDLKAMYQRFSVLSYLKSQCCLDKDTEIKNKINQDIVLTPAKYGHPPGVVE